VVEVPITFVERARGASKMDRTVVVEALWLIARWGIAARWRSLRTVLAAPRGPQPPAKRPELPDKPPG